MTKFPLRAALALCACLALVACGGGGETEAPAPAPAPAATTVDPATAGSITGTVSFAGDDPDTEISMNADPNCAALHSEPVYTQRVVTDGQGHLANVFVKITSGLSGTFPAPAETIVLTQTGCRYVPHVFGVQVGQTLKITNGDKTLHNVHATPTINDEFNQAQPFVNMELERTFDEPEMVPFKCDVHPWMSAYAGVVDHPYFAVSAADGTFTIDNVPPGTYTVETWHEEFGPQTHEVTVGESAAALLDVTYGG